jgi:serine/threonine protein kinase
MALTAGTRLGPYEVLAPLGAGGMGEVYRARDTRLNRTVAIKVLAPDLAGNLEFRQRFHSEARTISQLTHPHICTLHDIGEHEGTTFLVMELLVGETLEARLARGTPESPALSLDAAMQIGIQIADALALAHQHGIVHRDLKPGNVMLSKPGTGPAAVPHAKLLDFGLAKAASTVAISELSTSPPPAVTVQGAILGTIQYMAPEQIEGGTIDTRSDIFALGSVLYEMLTGRKPFEGKSPANVMAAILEREPAPVSAFQPRVPALVEATVQKCLAKDPNDRWQNAADLATALRWASSDQFATKNGTTSQVPSRPQRRLALLATVAAVATLAAAGGAALACRYTSRLTPLEETRFDVQPPETTMWSPSPVAATAQLALSPDGRRLAFVAAPRRGLSRIWVRLLGSTQAQPVAGTEGASFPFWSPDSRSLGFFGQRQAQDSRPQWRRATHHRRGVQRPRWLMGTRWRHPVHPGAKWSGLSSVVRWSGVARVNAPRWRHHDVLAAVPSRRSALPVLRTKHQAGGPGNLRQDHRRL